MNEPGDPFELSQRVEVLGAKLRAIQDDLRDWLDAYNDSYPAADLLLRIYEEHFGDWEPDWDKDDRP